MKILASLENLFTPYVLVALNLAIILAAEFVGGGLFFAETGLMHAIAIIFVALITIQIFTDYAYSDYILKGFLKIQLGFFLFLGFVHLYEYVGLNVLMLNDKVVETSVAMIDFIWFLGVFMSLEFVSRIYYKKNGVLLTMLGILVLCLSVVLVGINMFSVLMALLPSWFSEMMLVVIVALLVAEISSIVKMRRIMPIFNNYSDFAIPAMVLLFFAALSEYFESTGFLGILGVSNVQNLYVSHFLIFATLSLLLIGFGKLKKPTGIYEGL